MMYFLLPGVLPFGLGFRKLSTFDLLSTYYFITDRDFSTTFLTVFCRWLICQIIAFSTSIVSNHFGEICVHNPTAIGQTFKFRVFAI